jgi:predicted nucleic acid-binding Zn ribbon protein
MAEIFGDEKSLAFERKGGRLKVLLEDAVPRVKLKGETYYVTESPSITIGGKKYFVEEIA